MSVPVPAAPAVAAPWHCPNCEIEVATPFCARCGERPIKTEDLTFGGALARIAHAATSVDGRVLRTFSRLLRHPGTLTLAYVEGQRKPFATPFAIFLIANVLFFTVQSLTHISVLGATLDSHLHVQDWKELAQLLLDRHLRATQTPLALYTPIFDRAVVVHAKSLVVLMVLPFAGLLALLFLRQRQRFMAHLAFSLHFYAFLMLVYSLAVVFAKVVSTLGGPGLESAGMDLGLTLFNLAVSGFYLHAALGPAYAASGAPRIVKTLMLTIAALAIVIGYRFAIFLITLYTN
ncbi:MAG: DUF3667 domain-containing protein [Burkholderiales bacterium]|nr:DUF3667 domain-containing protein [Burkholderiales bacterium]